MSSSILAEVIVLTDHTCVMFKLQNAACELLHVVYSDETDNIHLVQGVL